MGGLGVRASIILFEVKLMLSRALYTVTWLLPLSMAVNFAVMPVTGSSSLAATAFTASVVFLLAASSLAAVTWLAGGGREFWRLQRNTSIVSALYIPLIALSTGELGALAFGALILAFLALRRFSPTLASIFNVLLYPPSAVALATLYINGLEGLTGLLALLSTMGVSVGLLGCLCEGALHPLIRSRAVVALAAAAATYSVIMAYEALLYPAAHAAAAALVLALALLRASESLEYAYVRVPRRRLNEST